MIFKQYYLNCLAHASFLIGNEVTQEAAVIDPQRDVDQYLEDARKSNLEIRHVFLTHCHADFIAGHLELRDREGSRIYLGAQAKAEFEFTAMKDGDILDLGNIRLQTLETPGHTVESICILLYDLPESEDEPHAVLTGDTLFVGDVGRPDLRASLGWSAHQLGEMLYDSVHEKLLKLPDKTLVYSAHGAGSLCGKNLSAETVSTVGDQRRHNYALQRMSKEDFIRIVTADQPEAPEYFTYDAILNTKERDTLEQVLRRELKPLSLDQVLDRQRSGAQVLDTRDPADFAKAHLVGSFNIGLGGQYATWAGTLLNPEESIVLISEPGREEEGATRLGRIGFDRVSGYLQEGIQALEQNPDLVDGWDRIDAATLADELSSPSPPLVIDVRAPKEREAKHIKGSVHFPLNQLRGRASELPKDRTLALHCAGGYRSSIAASILQQEGFTDIEELAGGIAAWEANKRETIDRVR